MPNSDKISILQSRSFQAVGLFVFVLCAAAMAPSLSLAESDPDAHIGIPRAQGFDSVRSCASPEGIRESRQALDDLRQPRTRVEIMSYRYVHLCETLAAYNQTGVPLIAFDGSRYFQAGRGDDSGMFYYIPRLARFFGTDLDLTIDLFYAGIATISCLIGLIGLRFLLKKALARMLATTLVLIVFALSFLKGDTYVFQSSIVVAVVPWFLYLVRSTQFSARLLAFVFIAGLCAGVSNNMRAHAGTLVTLFMVWVLALHFPWNRWQRLLLVGLMLLGLLLPVFHLEYLLANADSYLTAFQPNGVYPPRARAYWHTIYIGFGFLTNPYVPGYLDQVANQKAQSISPGILLYSPGYERILREETFALVKQHPMFALLTVSAKLGVIGVILLVSMNVGLLAAAWYPKDWRLETAFWVAMLFGSLSSILAVPRVQYLLGAIAFAAIYCAVSVEHALECFRSGDVQGRLGVTRRILGNRFGLRAST